MAAVLLAAALILFMLVVASLFSLTGQIRDFQRLPAPGHGEVTFTEPGRYFIYVEERGQCCSLSVGEGTGPIDGWSLMIAMASASSDRLVPVRTWRGLTTSYAVAGHAGQTAMEFTIARPGTYLLATKDVRPRAITDLAVGRGILPGMLRPVLLAVPGFCALVAAALMFGITAYRRSQARRALPPPGGLTGPVPWPPPWEPSATGLFRDQSELARGAAEDPLQDLPPAEYMTLAAENQAPDATATSLARLQGLLVLSRPARRLVALTLGVGTVGLVVLVTTFVVGAPGGRSQAHPAAHSRVVIHSPSPRTAPPSPAATPPASRDQRWLRGLGVLMRQMEHAVLPGTITPQSLRLTAAILRRCPSELASLGPPPSLYRPTYHLASRACAIFVRASVWARAAAQAYTITAPSGPAGRRFGHLLDRSDSAVNRGIILIDDAYYGAPVIGP